MGGRSSELNGFQNRLSCARAVHLSLLLQSIMLLLHSKRRYIFEYDQTDRLVSVVVPSMAKHTLQSLLSIGYYRNIHTPPASQASFVQDYTLDGRLLKTQYLGTGRSVIYRCDTSGRDWFDLNSGCVVLFLGTTFRHRKHKSNRLNVGAIIQG